MDAAALVENQKAKIDLVKTNGFEGVLPEKLIKKASSVLETIQFPTTRTEAWKYTRLSKISNKKFSINKTYLKDVSNYLIVKDTYTFVFVNGFLQDDLSVSQLPKGLTITSIQNRINNVENYIGKNITLENEVFNTLNTTYTTDGAYIHIHAKSIIEKPIQIIHILSGSRTIANMRNVIISDSSSQAHIIQGFFSENANESFTNVITEVFVKENAHLSIDKVQFEDETCYQINTEQVEQDKNSNFTINTITLNGGLIRNNLNIDVNGQNCISNLSGAYLLKGNQHIDNHTVVDHKVPNCESHELYKGVIDDKSTAVFNGKVFVRKNAQKINAFQSNANVLLSDDATVDSKPELEIYADDVKCSHGSTTGQLDEEAIFYLRARGISEKSARKLIVSAFIKDVLLKIDNKDFKEYIHRLLKERFDWGN